MRAIWMLCLLLFMSVKQQAQSTPTIEYFTVDNNALHYPAVEAGVEAANFSWRVVGLREGDQLQMHALVGGQWRLIGAGFEPEKTDRLVIAHPLDFIPPTYRLSVVDSVGAPVADHILELSYAPPEGRPTVRMFLAFPPVEIMPMSAFDEPFHVQWQVDDRWFNSNLVFEQVLLNGTILDAEYSRPAEWQYAHKDDYLHIVYPGDYRDVVLQLRIVNRDDGSTLVRQQLTLHVDNNVAPQPEAVNFAVTPETAKPGETVTLAWEVVNTDVVFIEYHDGNPNGSCAGNLESVYELPTNGTLEVTTPEAAYTALQFRLLADFYIKGTRHNCSSPQAPLGELSVSLTDYIGQGVDYFRVEPLRVAVGDTVTVSWSVTEGQSVTITYPNTSNPSAMQDSTSLPTYATYADLPLTGSIDVTIPDAPGVRRAISGDFWLYIIEDGVFPPVHDYAATVIYDRDGNLDCDTQLTVGENDAAGPDDAVPGTNISVTWDSCGNENTLIRLALVAGDYQSPPVSEEFIPVDPSGTMTVSLPDEAGTFYIQLHYEHADERYMLLSSPLILKAAQGW